MVGMGDGWVLDFGFWGVTNVGLACSLARCEGSWRYWAISQWNLSAITLPSDTKEPSKKLHPINSPHHDDMEWPHPLRSM
jgi:hypothetical protein